MTWMNSAIVNYEMCCGLKKLLIQHNNSSINRKWYSWPTVEMLTFILSQSANIWWKHQVVLIIHSLPKFKDKYHHEAVNMFKMLNAMTHYTFSINFFYLRCTEIQWWGWADAPISPPVGDTSMNRQSELQIRLVRKWNIAADRIWWNMITITALHRGLMSMWRVLSGQYHIKFQFEWMIVSS